MLEHQNNCILFFLIKKWTDLNHFEKKINVSYLEYYRQKYNETYFIKENV